MRYRPEIILKCEFCEKDVIKKLHHYRSEIKQNPDKLYFCSRRCQSLYQGNSIFFDCNNCGEKFFKIKSQSLKVDNHFCSKSCAATYNNTHKTNGNRRSKLEMWLEEQLTLLYPDLEIWYSDKTTINSELDIYIPSLNLAFELNGIFHYEPIFGESKLEQIQNNDHRKFQACLEKGIELCIIDTSLQKYFKESTSQKYLDIITTLVNMKLSKTDYVEVL